MKRAWLGQRFTHISQREQVPVSTWTCHTVFTLPFPFPAAFMISLPSRFPTLELAASLPVPLAPHSPPHPALSPKGERLKAKNRGTGRVKSPLAPSAPQSSEGQSRALSREPPLYALLDAAAAGE